MTMFILSVLLVAFASHSSEGIETGTIVDCSTTIDAKWGDCFDETDASGDVTSYRTKQELFQFSPDPALPDMVTCILVERKEECPSAPPSPLSSSPSGESTLSATNSTTKDNGSKTPCRKGRKGKGQGRGNGPLKGNSPRGNRRPPPRRH